MENLQSELREYLNKDEYLLWSGKPKTGVVFRAIDIFLIPFSIFWCGFAIFWMYAASSAGGLFALFGIPFVIMGLFFVFGRFVIDAMQRANTIYGLTQKRIIIKSGVFSKSFKSLNIANLTEIEFTEKSNGIGTISIGPKNPYSAFGNGMNWLTKMNTQLELIRNVRKVYNQIIEIQNKENEKI